MAIETVAVGSHVLEVQGYSKIKDAFRADDSTFSGKFQVGGHTWKILCDPWGGDAADWVVVNLSICSYVGIMGLQPVMARFSFALLRRDAETGEYMETMITGQYTFKYMMDDYWSGEIIEREQFESPLYLKDDSFRIRCDIAIVREFLPKAATVRIPAAPSPELGRHLGGLLTNSQVGGDVAFKVSGEVITAHKCMLAAGSPVFKDEFFGPSLGKEDNTSTAAAHIQIDDMKPEVFKAMLHFIYTDALPEIGDDSTKAATLQGLIVAVDRYKVERLRLICGDMLCNYVDAGMAATWLLLARKHGCCRLKEACMRFLRDLLGPR